MLYDGRARGRATACDVDVALLHLGGVRFPVTGPLRYTMTARDAIELCELLRPRVAIPIHYEGWEHFKEGRDAIERELARAPEEVRRACAGCRSARRSPFAELMALTIRLFAGIADRLPPCSACRHANSAGWAT